MPKALVVAGGASLRLKTKAQGNQLLKIKRK